MPPERPEDPTADQHPGSPPEKGGLLNQDELDRLVEATKARDAARSMGNLLSGIPAEIEKEPIEDLDVFKTLMGPYYREGQTSTRLAPPEPPPEGYRVLFEQLEVDALAHDGPSLSSLTEAELLSGERPPIESDPIDDPRIYQRLMGPYYAPREGEDALPPLEESDREWRGGLTQDEVDAAVDTDRMSIREIADELIHHGTPEIEKESIEDDRILRELLGDDYGADRETEESTKPAPESESAGLFTQEQLDAFLAKQPAPKPATEADMLSGVQRPIEREEISDSEILSRLMGPEWNPAEEAAAEVAGSASSGPGLMTQEELDALVESQSRREVKHVGQDADAPCPPIDKEAIADPEILKALLGPDYEAYAAEAAEPEDAVPKPDVEAILSEASAAASVLDSPPPEGSATDQFGDILADLGFESEDATPEPEVFEIGDDMIDEDLVTPIVEEASAEEPEAEETPQEALAEVDHEALVGKYDNDDIDTLIGKLKGEIPIDQEPEPAPQPAAAAPTPAPAQTRQPDVEELIAQLEDEPVDETETAIVGADADEPLVDSDMDERLVQVNGDDAPVVEGADEMTPIAEFPDESVVNENIAAGATEDPGLLSQDLLDQLVQDAKAAPEEAAGAAPAEAPSKAPAPVAAAPASAADDSDDVVVGLDLDEEDVAAPVHAPRSDSAGIDRVIRMSRRNPRRAAAAIAAGVLVAVGTLALLYQNRLRPLDDKAMLAAARADELSRVIKRAESLIDGGAYLDAVALLEPAIAAAPVSALRTDAEFLLVEAKYLQSPDRISDREGAALHAEIDRLVEFAVLHPRAPEALYWKAKLYEKENNALAARSVYREILADFGNTANLDETLLAAAELELAQDKPLVAAEYLGRLLEEFPGSPLAAQAHLLRGDAFAAAGDPDTARIAYVRSVEAHSGTRIAADAFERLGELAYETGNYADAIRELETRLATATSIEGNDNVYLLLAKSYRAAGRAQDARNVLNELLRFFPESEVTALANVELSRALLDMGMRKEALRVATETVQRYPDNPAVLRNQGQLLTQSGDVVAAGRALLAADAAGADDPELLLAAGRLFHEAGRLSDARDAFDRVTAGYPSTPQAVESRIELAKVMYEEGKIGPAFESLEDMRALMQAQPQYPLVLAALGELYKDIGLRERSAAMFAQIAASTSEPEMLARASISLIEANEFDEALAIGSAITASQLSDRTAYRFLNAQGRALLRADPRQGIDRMERAYGEYPLERTAEGDEALLEANLTTGRASRARALVSELRARVANGQLAPERLETAATIWGDFLFDQRDYRAAADAYSVALTVSATDVASPASALSPAQEWIMFQRANALFELSDFEGSIDLYERIADSRSSWADEAQAKADSARIEQRLRGAPVSEVRDSG